MFSFLIGHFVALVADFTGPPSRGPFFVPRLKGSLDAHFPQVDMILKGLNEKSITYFG